MSIEMLEKKMIQVITNSSLESRLKEDLSTAGVTAYTEFNVRGNGSHGLQDSHIEGDTNILLMLVVSVDKYESVMKVFRKYKKRKHSLMVFSINVEVLP